MALRVLPSPSAVCRRPTIRWRAALGASALALMIAGGCGDGEDPVSGTGTDTAAATTTTGTTEPSSGGASTTQGPGSATGSGAATSATTAGGTASVSTASGSTGTSTAATTDTSSSGDPTETSTGSTADGTGTSTASTDPSTTSTATTEPDTTGTTGPAVDPCSPAAALEVVAFNVRFDDGGIDSRFDVDGWENTGNPRRQRVLDTIAAMDPDILGMQEVLANQVSDLSAALPDYAFVGVGRDDGMAAGEHMAVYVRTSRLTILDSGHYWLSDTPEVPGTVFDCSGSRRMVTWLRLRDELTGRTLLFANTHWDNACQSSRERSATLMRSRWEQLAAGDPVVMTGDLNQSVDNVAVQTLLVDTPAATTQLVDGYRTVNPPAADERTFHGFNGGTQGSRIDYVLHDAAFRTTAATIVRTAYQGRYPSDHYPVTGTLQWTTDEQGNACP